jgi:FMN phosphatase YigB (HAD superfamily)
MSDKIKLSKSHFNNNTMQILHHKAVSQCIFDYVWYKTQYKKLFLNDSLSAFEHYLRVSKFSNISPSPSFDGETYMRMNLDVYDAGISPVEHFINNGRAEGRISGPVIDRWLPKSTIQPLPDLTIEASALRVAIVLHIYYPDYIDRFSKALEGFPIPFDVYLACGEKVAIDDAEQAFRNLPHAKNVKCNKSPNRGRNFGPMLVEFGEKLLDYDILCHLHSKKSLYSGKEKNQWSEYLIEYLLRDVEVVTQALNAFASYPQIGVYYPTPFWVMPNWVNHWTRNRGQCHGLFQKFGQVEMEEDFLTYPVGGMFWVRPRAIFNLLKQKYSYEDFTPEPVPPDGTNLHALERLIGLIAEQNSYTQLFFYPPRAEFTDDKSYMFQSYVTSPTEVIGNLVNNEVISFDLFDTLVRRKYTAPDYAKLKLGHRLTARGIVKSASDFLRLRNSVEFELRKKMNFQGDVTLEEICCELAQLLKLPKSDASELAAQEFLLDFSMMLPKDEMVEIFNYLSEFRKVWIVTDTYYNKKQIERILQKIALNFPDQLFVSSELKMRKDNLTLWHHIKEKIQGEKISSHIHVGDNVVSDAQLPGDIGLRTFHILHPLDKWQALGYPIVLRGSDALNENSILKWGPLISQIGRNPFLGH